MSTAETPRQLAERLITSGDIDVFCVMAQKILSDQRELSLDQVTFLNHPKWIAWLYTTGRSSTVRSKYPVLFGQPSVQHPRWATRNNNG